MRPRLSCALLALAASLIAGDARATHVTFSSFGIRGISELPYKFNLAACEDDRELEFVWLVQPSTFDIRTSKDYDYEIRASTAEGTTCEYGSATDECVVVVSARDWDLTFVEFSQEMRLQSTFFSDTGCTGTGTRKAVLFIKDNQPVLVGGSVEPAHRQDIEFKFDFDAPPAPAAPVVAAGDQGLNVSWPSATGDGGIRRFKVYWSTDASKLTGRPNCPAGSTYRTGCAFAGPFSAGSARISGLQNGETVHVAIAELDDFDNEGPVSTPVAGVPASVLDFFEQYAESGGAEQGGFCFIATATYGSPIHPLVRSLRKFRDEVLLTSSFGRELVDFYYSWSPAMAEVIDDTPHLKILFRLLLAPVAVAAWFVVDTTWWQKIFLLFFGWLALRGLRRFWRAARSQSAARVGVWIAAAICAGYVTIDAAPARAEESPRNFYLELKIGAIAPEMDRRAGSVGTAAPYATIFGDASRTVGGFELEYQILKDVGSFGVSGAMMFWQAVGRGRFAATGEVASETSVLNVMPFQVNAVYRFDIPMRRHGVPLVPYVKAGFDWYLWWVLDGSGSVSTFTDRQGSKRRGLGGTFGIHAALGLQFQLDVIDRRMQKSFDEEVGINHSYLFAEVVFSRVDDFNQSSFNFSSIYFLAGLALEF